MAISKKSKRKIFVKENFENCETGESRDPGLIQDLIDRGRTVQQSRAGPAQTPPPQPFITFNSAQNEKIIANSNAYIVLGQDRPGGIISGEGKVGAPSDTIDLVVGRMASANDGAGPCDGMFVGNSAAADAARIYISKLTKVDLNFGIMRTEWEESLNPKGEAPASAIAVKADKVRIIGRAGVKIVTGGMRDIQGYGRRGEKDSTGADLEYSPQIDLIAGNYTGPIARAILTDENRMIVSRGNYIEPIARGYKTRAAFEDLADMLDHLMGLMFQSTVTTQAALSGIGSTITPLSAVTAPAATSLSTFGTSPSYNLRISMVEFKFKYLNDRAPSAVWSRNVNST